MATVKIAQKQDIPAGQMQGFNAGGKQILVANVGGAYYAVDAICTHMKGYLPAGTLKDNIVTCPVHGSQYDVTTGKVHKNVNLVFRLSTGRGAADLNTYEVVVEGDDIKVNI